PVHDQMLEVVRERNLLLLCLTFHRLEREHDISESTSSRLLAERGLGGRKRKHVGWLVLAAIATVEILNGGIVAERETGLGRLMAGKAGMRGERGTGLIYENFNVSDS